MRSRSSFLLSHTAVRNNPGMSFESEYPRRLREMQQGGDSISGSDHLSGSSSRRRPEAPFNRRLSGHQVAITPVQAIRLLDSGLRRNDERECGIDTSHVEPQGSKLFRTTVSLRWNDDVFEAPGRGNTSPAGVS
jgi:hypothetical protein